MTVINREIQDLIKRFKLFGIKTIVVDKENSSCSFNEIIEEGYLYEEYDYPFCDSFEHLLNFCIDNKVRTIYAEPIRFDYECFCNSIEEDYSEFILEEVFNQEMLRLRKAFSKIDNDKMRRILEREISDYINSIDSRVALSKTKNGRIIEYNFTAYCLNQCMKYDLGEATAYLDDYDPFARILFHHKESLITAMELEAYNENN